MLQQPLKNRRKSLDPDASLAGLQDDRHNALSELFTKHRQRLKTIVAARLDKRLSRRIDASDVLQDTLAEASQRLDEYLANPSVPFDRWLAFLAEQNSVAAYRWHVQTQKRSINSEQAMDSRDCSAAGLALKQLRRESSDPQLRLVKAEVSLQLADALASLPSKERELLQWRYFDGKSIPAISNELKISVEASSKRVLRALKRLGKIMQESATR